MNVKRVASFIGLVLLLCAGSGTWLLTRPLPLPPVRLHPTVTQIATAQRHLATLNQIATRSGLGPRTVRLSESDLNVTLSSSKPLQSVLADHGIGAVQIELQEPNVLVIHASMRVHGFWQNVQITGTLVPDPKSGVRFDANRAQAGRFPLPLSFVTAQVDRLAARFSQPLLAHLPLTVQSLSVQKKELVLVGIPLVKASPRSKSPAHH